MTCLHSLLPAPARRKVDFDGRSVGVIVPDATRSCPLPLLLGAVREALDGRTTRVTVLVALGTHAENDRGTVARPPGRPVRRRRVTVTLATGIPAEVVRAANLDYLDPSAADLDLLAADPDTLLAPGHGHVLYRLR